MSGSRTARHRLLQMGYYARRQLIRLRIVPLESSVYATNTPPPRGIVEHTGAFDSNRTICLAGDSFFF